MAALPENDRIAGPFIADAGQTDFPADFPLIDAAAVRLRIRRAGAYLPIESAPAVSAVAVTSAGFTARRSVGCQAGDKVWVYSQLAPQRLRQHTPNGAIRTATLEDDAIAFQAQLQEHRRDLGLTLSVLPGDPAPTPEALAAAAAAGEIAAAAQAAALSALSGVTNRIAKDKYPVIRDLLETAGDGTTDCAGLLARTDVAFLTLPPGDYRVKSNVTVTRPLYFAPGSKMTIDTGKIVTFSGKGRVASDSRRQLFYGEGNVFGLPFVDMHWFAGDKVYFIDSEALVLDNPIPTASLGPAANWEIGKAALAVKPSGHIRLQEGCLTLSGTEVVDFPFQCCIRGEQQASIFIWPGTSTYGFSLNFANDTMDGFWMRRANVDVPATEGIALNVGGGQSAFRHFTLNGAYIGANTVGHSGAYIEQFVMNNTQNIGVHIVDTNDAIVRGGLVASDTEYLSFSGAAGGWNPNTGDTLTGATSGSKFRVRRRGAVYLIATKHYGVPDPIIGETYSSSSGGTATLALNIMHHNLGACRVVQTEAFPASRPPAEGAFLDTCEWIGGRYSLVVEGWGTGPREGPSFCRATNSFFDSALEAGVVLNKTDGWTFSGCWISARGDGLAMRNVCHTRFIGCDIRLSSKAGVIVHENCVKIDFTDCTIADNRYGVPGNTGANVYVENDINTHLTFKGGIIGRSRVGGIAADYGIDLVGSGGQVHMFGVRFGSLASNKIAPIRGLTSLTSYTASGCNGLLLKNRGSFAITSGSTTGPTIPHGITPLTFPSEAVRMWTSNQAGLGGAYCIAVPTENITATTFQATLYNNAATPVAATRDIVVGWEIDLSYKV